MVKPLIFWVCIATGTVISMGCATGPKKTFGDQLAEARQTLAMIKVPEVAGVDIHSKTTQQAYDLMAGEGRDPEVKKAVDEAEEKLNKAFAQMLTTCQGPLAGFESQGRYWGVAKVVIATLGTVAGAIVVPALTAAAASANAVWISGFGGVAGASNAAQQALSDVGFTATSVLQTRQKILEDWKEATRDYFNPESTYDKRSMAIQRGLTACTLYAVTVPGQQIAGDSSNKGSVNKKDEEGAPQK